MASLQWLASLLWLPCWLELSLADAACSTLVQSCTHLLWEMDRNSCFFYRLKKKRGVKKHITCLLVVDGSTLIQSIQRRCVEGSVYLSTAHLSLQEYWQDLKGRVAGQLCKWTELLQCLSP